MPENLLNWTDEGNWWQAQLGTPDDGVLFSMERRPSCYRRGIWRLLVEVCSGPAHTLWGCFDEADQPQRYYHQRNVACSEAEAMARVLWSDRQKAGPLAAEATPA